MGDIPNIVCLHIMYITFEYKPVGGSIELTETITPERCETGTELMDATPQTQMHCLSSHRFQRGKRELQKDNE